LYLFVFLHWLFFSSVVPLSFILSSWKVLWTMMIEMIYNHWDDNI
jgi:hypothetical protein